MKPRRIELFLSLTLATSLTTFAMANDSVSIEQNPNHAQQSEHLYLSQEVEDADLYSPSDELSAEEMEDSAPSSPSDNPFRGRLGTTRSSVIFREELRRRPK
jgi:hypothetical protein